MAGGGGSAGRGGLGIGGGSVGAPEVLQSWITLINSSSGAYSGSVRGGGQHRKGSSPSPYLAAKGAPALPAGG